jgi:hypothetical protein
VGAAFAAIPNLIVVAVIVIPGRHGHQPAQVVASASA